MDSMGSTTASSGLLLDDTESVLSSGDVGDATTPNSGYTLARSSIYSSGDNDSAFDIEDFSWESDEGDVDRVGGVDDSGGGGQDLSELADWTHEQVP